MREILGEIYKSVQRWFLGQLAYMAIIGSLFTVAWFAIGIPFALLLGILSGLLTFIPVLGPLISIIPPILLALVDDPIKALWVILLYLAIQAIESHVVHPLVMSQAVSLHPALVIFAIVIMGTLFGFIGILLAIPLVAALYVLVHELWTKRMDEKGTDPNPPPEDEPSFLRSGSPVVGCDEPQKPFSIVLELALGEKSCRDPAPPERFVFQDREMQRQRGLQARDSELVQSSRTASESGPSIFGVDDELGQQ